MAPRILSLSTAKRLHYCIEYETNESRRCEDYGCHKDGGMCRCSTIDSIDIVEVYIDSLVDEIVPSKKHKMLRYGVDRILRHHKVYEPNYWDTWSIGGYYGEEVGGASLAQNISTSVDTDVARYSKLKSLKDQVEFLLQLEYGYLLDSLKGCSYRSRKVPLEQIHIGNEEYRKRVDAEMVEHYSRYPYYTAVVLREDVREFRLVDGYHRLTAANRAGDDKVNILVAIPK